MRVLTPVLLLLALFAVRSEALETGAKAPPLNGTLWVGNPVSLDAVKGNVVVLAFWNLDAPC